MRIKFLRTAFFGGLFAPAIPVWAVYAPVPAAELGQEFTYEVRAGISYDSNIFGSASSAISSTIFEVAPKLTFNYSATQATFVSASYQAVVDYYDNRPGKKTLDSHYLAAKLAHTYSKTSSLLLTESYSIIRDPESTLNGVPVNSDQSYENNSFDGRFNFAPTEATNLTLKAQDQYFHYLSSALADQLDHNEDLLGLEGDYSLQEDLKAAGEYRHQDDNYAHHGSTTDKESEFLMVGADYKPGPKTSVGFRVGGEFRSRSGASSTTTPYAELTAKYAYGKNSFVSFGYTYDLEETSDVVTFTDSKVNRFFLNVQHALTPTIVASGSLDYEPSILLGRSPNPNVDEDTTRAGLALSYLPNKNLTISVSYDYDHVTDTAIPGRGLDRNRGGVTATYTF